MPDNLIKRVIQFAKQGYKDIDFPVYDTDWDQRRLSRPSPARTRTTRCASPTNSSKRSKPTASGISPGARSPARSPRPWKARELWEKIGHAAWACADPGLQYHTTVNDWHTCPASGPIRGSNPCSEYMFLDDTACNLASLNLLDLPRQGNRRSSTSQGYEHARAAVDHGAGNLGADGAVPVEARSPSCPTNSARSASATPISAAC